MVRNNWSRQEIKLLRANYLKMTHRELSVAIFPNRSKKSIEIKLYRLGLNRRKKWSKWEIDYLVSHKNKTYKEMSNGKLRGRTELAIRLKALKIGVKKVWLSSQDDYLKTNYTKEHTKKIAKHLGKSQGAIRQEARKIGLKKGHKTYHIQLQHKKLTSNLGYILGAIKGDGCVRPYTVNFAVTDKDFALAYKKAVEEQFGIERKIRKILPSKEGHKLQYKIKIGYYDICKFIKDFDLNKILKASKPIKYAFLRGIYDAEGSVGIYKKKIKGITFVNTDNPLIDIVSKILINLDINHKIYSYIPKDKTKKPYKVISLQRKESLIKFRDNIGFSIKRKQDRLKLLPKNMR